MFTGFLGGSVAKNPPSNAGGAGDMDSIHGSGKSPEEGNGNPLQYSCMGNLIPWTEGRLQSKGSQRVRHELVSKQQYIYIYPLLDSLPIKPIAES